MNRKMSDDSNNSVVLPHYLSLGLQSGVETVRILRSLGFGYLVVGLTASALSDDMEAYVEAGADLVLSKPLQMKNLDEILRFAGRHGSLSRAHYRLVEFPHGLKWVAREASYQGEMKSIS